MTVSPAKPSQPSQPDQPTHPDKLMPETARLFAGLNIVPAREIVNSGLCLGLCGTAGSGKTVTAANIHKSQHAGKVLVLDAEAGSSSIADMPVDVATIKRWSELQDVGKEITKNGTVEFGTIIIDNMTEIANMRLQEIAGGAQPQIQHFGQCTADLLRFTRYWRDLSRDESVNVIFCVWEETEQDPQTARWVKHVFFTPKLAQSWPGIVTMIGHIWPVRRKPDIRQLSFTVSPDTDAKFRASPVERAHSLPTEIYYRRDDPVLADMLDVIRGTKPWPTDRYIAPKQEPGS